MHHGLGAQLPLTRAGITRLIFPSHCARNVPYRMQSLGSQVPPYEEGAEHFHLILHVFPLAESIALRPQF